MSTTQKVIATLRPSESYYKMGEDGIRKPRFRYTVTGSPEAMAAYKAIKEAEGYFREDEKGVLFNSGVQKKTIVLEIIDGVIYAKTQDDSVMALEAVYHNESDPIVKAALAQRIADEKVKAAMRGGSAPANTVAAPSAEAEPASEEEANL